ncbi:phage tail tape measure protein [Bacillus thuringiensis]|uniref:phage tail tape measure protein n=1 Tax=Bacillus thuringiensis TaxID=1428 RepID=UPI002929F488|nr:phage tail tape measure protein [Bacillus cereus]HEB4951910.1 phage tail tape measure protein [Bacillus cereus]
MELFKMFGSIFLKDDQLQRGLTNAERSGQRTTGILGRGFGQVGAAAAGLGSSVGGAALALGGIAGLAIGLGAAFSGTVKEGMGFEKQMSKVEALTGSSSVAMGDLTGKARELGASTRYSATEVAEGMEYMALAGWNANQQIAAIGPLLSMATAGNMDLGRATDIVTDTMQGFAMGANEAGKAADQFAVIQASTNTNISQLGEAMKYVAPVAHAFGMDLAETNVILGEFANAGTKGSMAGTALRAGLSRLAKPPKDAAKALDGLGISTTNADGSMRKIRDIVEDMHVKFGNLSQSQKIAAAQSIFGQEAFSAWLPVIDAGGKGFDELKMLMDNSSGAADRMAKVMSNNLEGATKNMTSSLSNLGLVLFDMINPGLMSATNGTTGLIDGISRMLDPTGQAVEATKALATERTRHAQAEEIAQMMYEKGAISETERNKRIEDSNRLLSENLTAKGMLATKEQELAADVAAGKLKQEEANKILEESELIYINREKAINAAQEKEKKWQAVSDMVITPIKSIGEAISDLWKAAKGDDSDSRQSGVDGISILTKLGFSTEAITIVNSVVQTVSQGIEVLKALVSGDWGAASNFLDKLGFSPEQKADIIMFVQDVHAQLSSFIENVQSLIAAQAPVIMGIIGATWEFIKGVFNTIAPYLMPLLTDVLNFVNGIIAQITSFWKENGDQIVQAVKNAFSIIQSIIAFVMPAVMMIVKSAWDAIKDIIQGGVNVIMGIIKFFAALLTGDFRGMWDAAKQIFSGAIQLIWGLINLSFVTKILGAAKGLAMSFGSAIKGMWTTVVNYFKEFIKHPVSSVVSMAVDIGQAAIKITKKLVDPVKSAWDGIMGWIKKIKDGVVNMFTGIHIPTPKITVSGSLNPVNWVSDGLPSFGVKWAANGALIKPGNPTLIGVGDARGYDETVLPLRKQTFDAIANGIMGSLPLTQQAGVQQYASQGPTILQVNLNGREIAKEIYSDVSKFQESEKERLRVF